MRRILPESANSLAGLHAVTTALCSNSGLTTAGTDIFVAMNANVDGMASHEPLNLPGWKTS